MPRQHEGLPDLDGLRDTGFGNRSDQRADFEQTTKDRNEQIESRELQEVQREREGSQEDARVSRAES